MPPIEFRLKSSQVVQGDTAMSIRTANAAMAEQPRQDRRGDATPTRPAPLGPPRVLQHSPAPAQLSFFFKRV